MSESNEINEMVAKVTEQAVSALGRNLEFFEQALVDYAVSRTLGILSFEHRLIYKEQ